MPRKSKTTKATNINKSKSTSNNKVNVVVNLGNNRRQPVNNKRMDRGMLGMPLGMLRFLPYGGGGSTVINNIPPNNQNEAMNMNLMVQQNNMLKELQQEAQTLKSSNKTMNDTIEIIKKDLSSIVSSSPSSLYGGGKSSPPSSDYGGGPPSAHFDSMSISRDKMPPIKKKPSNEMETGDSYPTPHSLVNIRYSNTHNLDTDTTSQGVSQGVSQGSRVSVKPVITDFQTYLSDVINAKKAGKDVKSKFIADAVNQFDQRIRDTLANRYGSTSSGITRIPQQMEGAFDKFYNTSNKFFGRGGGKESQLYKMIGGLEGIVEAQSPSPPSSPSHNHHGHSSDSHNSSYTHY